MLDVSNMHKGCNRHVMPLMRGAGGVGGWSDDCLCQMGLWLSLCVCWKSLLSCGTWSTNSWLYRGAASTQFMSVQARVQGQAGLGSYGRPL